MVNICVADGLVTQGAMALAAMSHGINQVMEYSSFSIMSGIILGLHPANETALLCNYVFYWLGASLESAWMRLVVFF